jgi:hypothetical protein
LACLVIGIGALVALPAAGAGAAAPAKVNPCKACGHNLIANPGAEAGKGANADIKVKVPNWKPTTNFTAVLYTWSDGDLSPTSPGPPKRGKNYFYGGPSNAKSSGTQTVVVAASGVSTGKVRFSLTGWLGGLAGQGDFAVLTAKFETAKGAVLSTAKIGPVTLAQRHGESELLVRTAAGKVPALTRQVVLKLTFVREVGSDNDGLADNLSLVFSLPSGPPHSRGT